MDNRSGSHDRIPDYRSFSYLGTFKENTAFDNRSLSHKTPVTQGSTTTDRGSSLYLTSFANARRRKQADVFGQVDRLVNT